MGKTIFWSFLIFIIIFSKNHLFFDIFLILLKFFDYFSNFDYFLFYKFLKQLQPLVVIVFELLLFEFDNPKSNKSKMFVFVAKFVSFDELNTESKNTHKNSCVIKILLFYKKNDKMCKSYIFRF